ncbi:MAG: ATP-binding protein [Alphaproteobacteria bacterium]|nr:ATP-binding protein [Alphaproteobacteria bacterium]
MIRPKSQHALRILGFIALLSAIYGLAAHALLQPIRANIEFTRKEIQGLDGYEDLSVAYFESAFQEKLDINFKKKFQEIGDGSNLILDPVLSSYYAANLLFNDILLYVEHLLSRAEEAPFSHQDLPYHFARLDHAVAAICAAHDGECADLKALATDLKQALSPEARLGPNSEKELIGKVQQISQTTARILRRFLEERLETQIRQQGLLLAEIVCIYIFLVFLIGYSAVNVVRKGEIKHAREAQQLLARLAEKNDELEKFAHAAAHDLKEPIRTMRCYATLLKSEAEAELKKESAEYIGVIEGAAKRAEQMINDLLAYSQVSERPLDLVACDSAKEITTVLQDMKPLIEKLQPTIEMSELPVIRAVPSMFRRLMTNLLDNAIKYRRLGSPPDIHIEAKKEDALWHFSVADNGIGIARKDYKKVFEPFNRVNPEHRHEGQGIGLASCKKIVERLGGKIWIISNLDEGTTVHFTVPVLSEKGHPDRKKAFDIWEFFRKAFGA